MRRLSSFHFVTLDGYYAAPDGDTSWHPHDPESGKFASEAMQGGSTLLFGRVTYEMMASFWPTPAAQRTLPDVAKGMNDAEKLVFSRTLRRVDWSGTKIVDRDAVEAVQDLKRGAGGDMTLLGSASLLTQFASAGLIDEFQLLVDPLALGAGRSVFVGMSKRLALKLEGTRTFPNGSVLLRYRPA